MFTKPLSVKLSLLYKYIININDNSLKYQKFMKVKSYLYYSNYAYLLIYKNS